MLRIILIMFHYIRPKKMHGSNSPPIHIPIPKTTDELYMELIKSHLDELNRKVDEADRKLKELDSSKH